MSESSVLDFWQDSENASWYDNANENAPSLLIDAANAISANHF